MLPTTESKLLLRALVILFLEMSHQLTKEYVADGAMWLHPTR
jgi:hypothetical protein